MKKFIASLFLLSAGSAGALYDELIPLRGFYQNCLSARFCSEIRQIVKDKNPYQIVDLNCGVGDASIAAAEVCHSATTIYSIDMWADAGGPHSVYHKFLSNVVATGYDMIIEGVRMSPAEAALMLDLAPDFIIINMEDSEEAAYSILKTWYSKLSPGGTILSTGWDKPAAVRGIMHACNELGFMVYYEDFFFKVYKNL